MATLFTTRTRRRAAGAILVPPTALLGAAGGWWALSKHLPPLADDEWPYVGSGIAHRSAMSEPTKNVTLQPTWKNAASG